MRFLLGFDADVPFGSDDIMKPTSGSVGSLVIRIASGFCGGARRCDTRVLSVLEGAVTKPRRKRRREAGQEPADRPTSAPFKLAMAERVTYPSL